MGRRLLFQPAQGGGEQIGRFQAEHNGVAAFSVVITGGKIRNVSDAVEIHGEIEAAHAVYVNRARMLNCAAWMAASPLSSVITSIRPEKPCSCTFSWDLNTRVSRAEASTVPLAPKYGTPSSWLAVVNILVLKHPEIIENVDNKQYQRQKEEGGLPPVCEFAFQMVGNQGEQDVFEQEGTFAGQYDAVD